MPKGGFVPVAKGPAGWEDSGKVTVQVEPPPRDASDPSRLVSFCTMEGSSLSPKARRRRGALESAGTGV